MSENEASLDTQRISVWVTDKIGLRRFSSTEAGVSVSREIPMASEEETLAEIKKLHEEVVEPFLSEFRESIDPAMIAEDK